MFEVNQRAIVKEILAIHRKLLNGMDDLELTDMLMEAWRMDDAKPGETELMQAIDIGYISQN